MIKVICKKNSHLNLILLIYLIQIIYIYISIIYIFQMKNDQIQCSKCRRNIRRNNFLLHDNKCKMQKYLRSESQSIKSNIQSQPLQKQIFDQLQFQEQKKALPRKRLFQKCTQCNQEIRISNKENHNLQCTQRMIKCEFCQIPYSASLIHQHYLICQSRIPQENINIPIDQQQMNSQLFHIQESINNNQPLNQIPTNLVTSEIIQHQSDQLPLIITVQTQTILDQNQSNNYSSINPMIRLRRMVGLMRALNTLLNNINSVQRIIELRSISTYAFGDVLNLYMVNELIDYNSGLSQNQINLLKTKKYNKQAVSEDKCVICYCQYEQNEDVVDLGCRHFYHSQCIKKWLKSSDICPMCRNKVQVSSE